MFYSESHREEIKSEYLAALQGLQALMLKCVLHGQKAEHARCSEYLLHGAGRRSRVLRKSLLNVFELFPLTTDKPLLDEQIADVQINLHAFVLNLYGIFDNWAWAYIYRHNIKALINDRRKVGLFLDATKRHLPERVRLYLDSVDAEGWYTSYLKNYRDALAHRIPLYIPPMNVTAEEGKRYNDLESEKVESIKNEDWNRLADIEGEQAALGTPCFAFLHSYSPEENPKQVFIHTQMVADAKTVVEFGDVFFRHWHEQASSSVECDA